MQQLLLQLLQSARCQVAVHQLIGSLWASSRRPLPPGLALWQQDITASADAAGSESRQVAMDWLLNPPGSALWVVGCPWPVCLLAHRWYRHAHRHSPYEALFLIDCPTQQAKHLFGVEVGMEVHGGQHRGSHLYPIGLRARLPGPWLAPVALACDHVVLWLPCCCCNTTYLQDRSFQINTIWLVAASMYRSHIDAKGNCRAVLLAKSPVGGQGRCSAVRLETSLNSMLKAAPGPATMVACTLLSQLGQHASR